MTPEPTPTPTAAPKCSPVNISQALNNASGHWFVSMSTTTSGATIFYTTHGSTPTHSGATATGSTSVYGSSIDIGNCGDHLFNAIAYRSGYTDSDVSTQDFDHGTCGGGAMMMSASSAQTIVFSVWDGDWAILEEYDSSGAVVEKYVQGYHGLVKTIVANVYYYQDELGSTSHIANPSGQLLEYYRYNLYAAPQYFDANGNPLLGGTAHNVVDLGNGGSRWMPELGLYDLRNRFMSPDSGRFLQPDPIGFKGDASNLYRYVGNDWANRTDPMGLDDIAVSREVDVRLWQASLNSLHEALNAGDGKGRSQAVQSIGGKVGLGSKFGISGDYKDLPREEGIKNHEGWSHHWTRSEGAPFDKNAVPLGSGHVHLDKSGKDSPKFSEGPNSDYDTARKGQIVAKVNQSDPDHVFRLTPQTDKSKPQIRPINPPTKGELKKWPNPYDKSQSSKEQESKSQASNVEPLNIGGGGFVNSFGGLFIGGNGPPTGGIP